MGKIDYNKFHMDYWDEEEGISDFGDATHWLIQLEPNHRFKIKKKDGSISCYDWVIKVFACYADGTSPTESVSNFIFGLNKHNDMTIEYERHLSRMKVDTFWETSDEAREKRRDREPERKN